MVVSPPVDAAGVAISPCGAVRIPFLKTNFLLLAGALPNQKKIDRGDN
jgi:hypothetical protein